MSLEHVSQIIQVAILIFAFILGKYLANINAKDIDKITKQINLIATLSKNFISYAEQFLSDKSGKEKMSIVISMIYNEIHKYNIDANIDEIKSIAQNTYDTMKQSGLLQDKNN